MAEKSFIDLKLSKEKSKKLISPTPETLPRYPYGMTVELGREALKKLRYDSNDFRIGGKIKFSAIATVESIRKSQYLKGDETQSVNLQLTNIRIDSMPKPEKEK